MDFIESKNLGGKLKPLKYRKAVVSKKQTRIRARKIFDFLLTQNKDSNEEREKDLQYSSQTEQTLYEKNGGLHHIETDSDLENVCFTNTEEENPNGIKSCCSSEEKQNDVSFHVEKQSDFFRFFSEQDNSQVYQNNSLPSTVFPYHEEINSVNDVVHGDYQDSEKFGSSSTNSPDAVNESKFEKLISSWIVENRISQGAANSLLQQLRGFKGGINNFNFLPNDCRTLLHTKRKVNLTKMRGGNYFHFGMVEYFRGRQLQREGHDADCSPIQLLINIDGLPLSRNSSSSSFWPILGLIKGEKTPFVIGVFHGLKKPQCVNEFLTPFVEEFIKIRDAGGIDHDLRNGKTVKREVKIIAVVCDAPAKCMATGTAGHTSKVIKLFNKEAIFISFYPIIFSTTQVACSKCHTRGITYKKDSEQRGRVVFHDHRAEPRTHLSFISRTDLVFHGHERSILEKIDIDMVQDIVLDYMHVVCLGVMRKLLKFWVKRDTKRNLIPLNFVQRISERLVFLRKKIPKNFARLPRSLLELANWKATEFRQFLLYTGPLVLKDLLPEELFQHFLCFHTAIKLLSSNTEGFNRSTVLNHCERLLFHFVSESPKLYGWHFLTYNVHSLLHLVGDVRRFGQLDNYSSFPFENYLQFLKKTLKTGSNQPLSSLVRRFSEISYVESIKERDPKCNQPNKSIEMRKPHCDPFLDGVEIDGAGFEEAKIMRWEFSRKSPNNCAFLTDGSIIYIADFIRSNDIEYLIGFAFESLSVFDPVHSTTSNYTNTWHSLGLSNDIKSYPCQCVKSKGFVLPVFDEIEIDELSSDQEPCYTSFVVFELNMEQATY